MDIYFFDAHGGLAVVCSPDAEGAWAGGPRGSARWADPREMGLPLHTAYEAAQAAGRVEEEGGWSFLLPLAEWMAIDEAAPYGTAEVTLVAASSAREAAEEYVENVDWGDSLTTRWVHVAVYPASAALRPPVGEGEGEDPELADAEIEDAITVATESFRIEIPPAVPSVTYGEASWLAGVAS